MSFFLLHCCSPLCVGRFSLLLPSPPTDPFALILISILLMTLGVFCNLLGLSLFPSVSPVLLSPRIGLLTLFMSLISLKMNALMMRMLYGPNSLNVNLRGSADLVEKLCAPPISVALLFLLLGFVIRSLFGSKVMLTFVDLNALVLA